MDLNFTPEQLTESVFSQVEAYIGKLAFQATEVDNDRPWGGFFVIDENQTNDFLTKYFPELDPADVMRYGDKLSPKILVVAPEKKLSWQYHHRRAELWKVVTGPVGVSVSETDQETPAKILEADEIIQFNALTRHRLIGLSNWGVVAEIWQHTDPQSPSNEDDIVRVSDDFGR